MGQFIDLLVQGMGAGDVRGMRLRCKKDGAALSICES